jgi:hypothetical protein
MRLPRVSVIANFFLATVLSAPAWANASSNPAVPGTLNYVEGKVSIGSEDLNSKSIGSAELQPGESLTTGTGKAEILLTPGVFMRMDDSSSVKMISPSLTDTEIGINRGHAMVEVAEIHPENDILIDADGTRTRILKTGLYDFNLNQEQLRVFDGKALVEEPGKHATVKAGREVVLAADEPLKPEKFKRKSYEEGDLYRWSSLRSAYVAEANVDAAGLYAENGWGPWGMGWWGADWYWDPWFDAYTFIPGDGIFYSPFGWGFYSPWLVYQAPFYGYWRYGNGRRPVYHHFSSNYHSWGPGSHYAGSTTDAHGIYRGVGSVGGFRSGSRMMMGGRGTFGRFEGRGPSGGGLRGGGFGGGFHGGVGFHGGGGFHGR